MRSRCTPTVCNSRKRSRRTRLRLDVCARCDQSGAIRAQLVLFLLVHPHPSSLLRMDLHIHMFIHETLYVMRQYDPQFYLFEQMYTDSFNDQLSDADTVDYGELPDLIDE